MLRTIDLEVQYDGIRALQSVNIEVSQGKVVSVVGANGAGKSTLLKTISGLHPPAQGSIQFDGHDLTPLAAHQVIQHGLALVPEGRSIFAYQTVLRNLHLGAYLRTIEERDETLQQVFELFPRLEERSDQNASTLSGGEQQMLAIARGLMSRPKLIMFDEPSLGLAPLLVKDVFETIRRIAADGMTILLVEQKVREALELADYAYVLQTGRVVMEGTGAELLESDLVRQAYLGL